MVGVAAIVAEEASRAVVDHDDDIQVAVAVDIGIGAAPADDRAEEVGSGGLGPDLDVKVAADFARVPEELDRLLVALARLDLGDVGLEMSVGRKQVKPAIQVVVKEEEPELQRGLCCAPRP